MDMPFVKRTYRTLAILAVILMASTVFGNFHAGKWMESVDQSSGTGWVSPESFAPTYSPSGTWTLCVEGAEGFEAQMEYWLRDRLSSFTYGDTQALRFVTAVSDVTEGANVLHVVVKPDSLWMPLYCTYSDTVTVRYSNRTLDGWPDSEVAVGELSSGELRVTGELEATGTFAGLVGRPYLGEHRAKVLSDNVKSLIAEAYEGVRKAAR